MTAGVRNRIFTRLAVAMLCAAVIVTGPGIESLVAAAGVFRTGAAVLPRVPAAVSAAASARSDLAAWDVPRVQLGLMPALPSVSVSGVLSPSVPVLRQTHAEAPVPPQVVPVAVPAQPVSPIVEPAGIESAAPSTGLAAKVRTVLGTADQVWRRSFFGQSVDPEAAVSAEADRPTHPISSDPAFRSWLKKSKHPYAGLAGKLAERMSWEQARLLFRQGGIQYFPAKQGCEHACLGCLVRAGERRPIRQATWEEYTERVRALVGLQAGLRAVKGREFRLFNESVVPFYDSEPMSTLLPAEDGRPRTILDVAKFLHKTTGRPAYLVTSGWNPRSAFVEPAAMEMARDAAASKAPYLLEHPDGFQIVFQIKPVSKRFRDEAKAFITPILLKDSGFRKRFGEEFERFGFDFRQYPEGKGVPAYEMYQKIVEKNLKRFVGTSKYLADRMANIAALAPAIRAEKVQLNSYHLWFGGLRGKDYSPEAAFISAWMKPYGGTQVWLKHLEQRFARTYGKRMIPEWNWNVVDWELKEVLADGLGTPVALQSGAFDFTGAGEGVLTNTLPNMATWKKPVVQGLADQPVLALGKDKAPWEAARDRLDGTRHLDLTDAVRRSVAERIRQVTGGRVPAKAEDIRAEAVLVPFQGKRPEPWVDVQVDRKGFVFRFKDGRLYEKTHPPRPVTAHSPGGSIEKLQGRQGGML
ncbi:MAG: hypothetical protein WC943_08575 [Elusimicrobiota bacterium]